MKKYLLVVALTLISLGTNAQNLQGVKNFLRGFKYEIIVGINFPGATEPYNSPKIGYNLGFTARKEVKTFLNDKLGVYGLTGLVLTSRGGTTAIPFFESFGSDHTWSVSAKSLPIHVGCELKFKYASLFADFGPHILFAGGNSDIKNLSNSGVAFGGGYDMGIRFKKFAMSVGFDQDFTKLGTFTPNNDQRSKLKIESDKEKFNLTCAEAHIDLRWTF
jgi:hypothetical protein